MTCFVYACQGQDEIKVGISQNPKKRVWLVRYHYCRPVTLLRQWEMPSRERARLAEFLAHRLLADHWRKWEWFRVNLAVADAAIAQAILLAREPDIFTNLPVRHINGERIFEILRKYKALPNAVYKRINEGARS